MRYAGFVAHINNPDSFTRSNGQNFIQVIAHEGENIADP